MRSLITYRRPRVGIDLHGWTGIYQGTRSHLFGIYGEAVQLAPDIDFWFLAEEPQRLRKEWSVAALTNARVVDLPPAHGLRRLCIQLPAAVWKHELDLLHVQYRSPPIFPSRSIVTIHDVLFESYPEFFPRSFTWQSKLFYRFAARFAKRILTVSEYSRREIALCYGIDEAGITVTTNGVDRSRFHACPGAQDVSILAHLGLRPGEYNLTVGRLEPPKEPQDVD